MQKLILALLLLLYGHLLQAQALNDASVNDAEVEPNPLAAVGNAFVITFTLGNNGVDDITGADAANRITILIDLSKCVPDFVAPATAIDALDGNAKALFNFTYDPANRRYTGVQNAPIVSLEFYELDIKAKVAELSSSPGDYSIGAFFEIIPNSSSLGENITGNDKGDALTRTTTVLPVDLVSFTGVANSCDVRLDWTTVMEEKFSHFVVERSVNGRDFIVVQNVKGKNSATGSSYQLNVAGPNADGYYRLRMVDLDETYEFSPVIQVRTNCDTGPISIAPNPVTSSRIMVNGLRKPSSIKLFDLSGKLLQTVNTNKERQEVDLGNLPSGIYFIRIIQDDQLIKTSRLFKQ